MCALGKDASTAPYQYVRVHEPAREIANVNLVSRRVRSVLSARRDVSSHVLRSAMRISVGASRIVLCEDLVAQLCARDWG